MPWQSAAHRPGVTSGPRCYRAAPGRHPTRLEGDGFRRNGKPGNSTPVRSSETAHRRYWTATSYDSGLDVTSRE